MWAQTEAAAGRAGVRGFIVARGTPGLVPGKKETKLGIRASETAQVHFEDVRVHKDMMLGIGGEAAGGLADTKKMLDSTRPVVGAQAVGIARAAFEFLLERVQGGTAARHADGEPPAHHVRARRDADGDHGGAHARAPRGVDGRPSPRQRRRGVDGEGASARATAQCVTTRAMVLLGEEALEPGHPVEKWYRDAKIYDIFEGTGQIQRRIIAKHLTGQNPT